MALDTSGLIWAATEASGIIKYDGERFSRMDPAPINSEDETYYSSIIQVYPGFWLIASDGVSSFDGNEWAKTSYPEDHCLDLLYTGMGRVYALSRERLYYSGINADSWTEERVDGLSGAYQLILKDGLILIASESGLWLRNPSGFWTQLLDKPVYSAMPLGSQWLAVTKDGLIRLTDSGWTTISDDIKGYHSYVLTEDGKNTWIIGESGLWFVRQDGTAQRLYTQGGLELKSIQMGIASDAGGLFIASDRDLIRIDEPERWFDLRTLPFEIGSIDQVEVFNSDSCWLATSKGVYSIGQHSCKPLPSLGSGVVSGINSHKVACVYGEFGLKVFHDGKWDALIADEWISAIQWRGDSLFAKTQLAWKYCSPTFKLEHAVQHASEPTSNPLNVQWVHDVNGLATESSTRSVGSVQRPALLIRGIERRTKKENDPVIVKFGFRGLPNMGKGIPVEYRLNRGPWINIGSSRRLVLDRLRAGNYELQLRAVGSENETLGMPTYEVEVLPAAWKRPEFWVPVLVVALLLVGFLTQLFWRRRRDRKRWQKERAHLERMALRLQMNPHFTFNALESISAYVLEKKPKDAIVYLQKFSKLMRYTLENADEPYVSLDKEILALEHYIALEQMRFDHAFQSVFQVEEGLDVKTIGIPPMLVQPIVENAILHGLRPMIRGKREKAVLKLFIGRGPIKDTLLVQIEDNGIGRAASKRNKSGDEGEKRSAATRIVESRLMAMQKETGRHYSVTVEDLNEGTRVSFVLAMHQEWEDYA